jgi:hypothetical protein
MENAESTSASSGLGARGGATSESKPIVVSSEEALAKIVASETDRLIEKKRARWAEIGEESLNETVREFATENGLGDQDVEELTSLMSSWQSDRRYLHEGLMDGSISVTEMRNEMRQSKEQLEQEVEALIGEEAASVLLEPMLSRRGHF